MALNSYSALTDSVSNWLDRTDLTSVVPDFVTMAEAGFQRMIRNRKMLVRVNATVDSQYSSLPADFLEMKAISLQTDPIISLEYKTPQGIDELGSSYRTAAEPRYYTIINDYIEVLPAPDVSYTVEMLYYQKIPALASATTNWLLEDAPDLYLYGTLRQASPYLHEDERLPVWENLYLQKVAELAASNESATKSGNALSMNFTTPGR